MVLARDVGENPRGVAKMSLVPGSIYGGISQLGTSRKAAGGAVAAWLYGDYGGSGGARIDASNCVAAYCPIGAASYAASKVNLANPGTYDAWNDTYKPTWSNSGGWVFNGSSNFLEITNPGFNPAPISIIARVNYTGTNAYSMFIGGFAAISYGVTNETKHRLVRNSIANIILGNNAVPSNESIVMCATYGHPGTYCAYTNAILDITGTKTHTASTMINRIGVDTDKYWKGNIYSICVYNIVLSAQQVSGLTGAINALTSAGNYYL